MATLLNQDLPLGLILYTYAEASYNILRNYLHIGIAYIVTGGEWDRGQAHLRQNSSRSSRVRRQPGSCSVCQGQKLTPVPANETYDDRE